jgi:hypothetical protein
LGNIKAFDKENEEQICNKINILLENAKLHLMVKIVSIQYLSMEEKTRLLGVTNHMR